MSDYEYHRGKLKRVNLAEFDNDKEKYNYETTVCSVFGGKRCAHHRAVAILYDKGVRA